MNYTIRKKSYRHYELYDDRDALIGTLNYPSWFSAFKAELAAGNTTYNIAATGFFRSTLEVTVGDTSIATIKYNWSTAYEITMANGPVYRFKRTKMFGSRFSLFNDNAHPIIELIIDFQLSKFRLNYTITTDDNYSDANNPLLLLLTFYTYNYIRTRSASA